RDLDRDDDVAAIEQFASLRQFEAANHSLNHLPWLHTMSDEEIDHEINETHRRIETSLGMTPLGFRGPGFSCPDEVLRILARRGYAYDASLFPTSMAPIARAVFLMRTKLKGEQREKAKRLYGGFNSMRQPNEPHQRSVPESDYRIWEIPVSVMPWTRTPIHFSYVLFLASFSTRLAKTYFRGALAMCRRWKIAPSLLLHPPDFMGRDDDDDLAYLPGMSLSRKSKLDFVSWALQLYVSRFNVVTLIEQTNATAKTAL
ncbi:MAG: polysaccharide deacetylase family protein, partial [Planctomycetota bacterium]